MSGRSAGTAPIQSTFRTSAGPQQFRAFRSPEGAAWSISMTYLILQFEGAGRGGARGRSGPQRAPGAGPGGGPDPLRRTARAAARRSGDGAAAQVLGRELRPHGRPHGAHPVRLRARMADGGGDAGGVQVGYRRRLATRRYPHPRPRRSVSRRDRRKGTAVQGGRDVARLLRGGAASPALRTFGCAGVLDHLRAHERLRQPQRRARRSTSSKTAAWARETPPAICSGARARSGATSAPRSCASSRRSASRSASTSRFNG